MADKSQRKGARRPTADLVFLPLGGAGEIGMNLYLYGHGQERNREWLMVDCGVKFGDESDPGIDVIVPDISFIEQHKKSLQAIVLTHAHEDHMGAIPWLWEKLQVPVYCTAWRPSACLYGLARQIEHSHVSIQDHARQLR